MESFVNDWMDTVALSVPSSLKTSCDDSILLNLIDTEVNLLNSNRDSTVHIPAIVKKKFPIHSFWRNRLAPQSTQQIQPELRNIRQELPAWGVRDTFLQLIRENLVLFIQGGFHLFVGLDHYRRDWLRVLLCMANSS